MQREASFDIRRRKEATFAAYRRSMAEAHRSTAEGPNRTELGAEASRLGKCGCPAPTPNPPPGGACGC